MQGRLAFARAAPVADGIDPLDALRLARSRNVGAATYARLTARFGGPGPALEALPDLARRGGDRGFEVCSEDQALRELEAGARAGARLLVAGTADYPPALAELPDPPPILWLRGDAGLLRRPAVGVVGGRNASALGLRLAEGLAAELGQAGVPVVSGLARGVDGAAHSGALPYGTTAVLAGGVDVVYPPEHADLAAKIAETGALLSEAPPGLEPQARHFPRRNRVIAGLSRVVVVIEAALRSGSLITAQCALDQGREVGAAPGSPLDPRSGGGNALIREGAALVRDARDVLELLEAATGRPGGDEAAPEAGPGGFAEAPAALSREAGAEAALRTKVAGLLGLSPVEEDVLARLAGAPLGALADALLELELAGRLDRRPGGMLALRPDAYEGA